MLSERERAKRQYQALIKQARAKGEEQIYKAMKVMALKDLYFLLTMLLNQKHMDQGPEYKRDFLFDRCREVQAAPDWRLDLWAREHYKSTIITYGKTIQDVLEDPEKTFGIFSFVRPVAKQFLNQIKRELEQNSLLKKLFPEVLWANPERDAPKWSENDGIILKRTGNPKEATIEAWGLVDGQPTSKHFSDLVYDDIVTEDTARSPEMMRKTTKAWELSLNLGQEGGRQRYAGTIYHAADTYSVIKERGLLTLREYPGTTDGTAQGAPVLYTPQYMAMKRKGMTNYVFSCQILLNPKADSVVGFDEEWIRYWPARIFSNLNRYIIVDPASSKKRKDNDYTVMACIGLGPDQNYYLIDLIRDRLDLTEKTRRLFTWWREYRPLGIGYEEYGIQADREHIEGEQEKINLRFDITPLGGQVSKNDRIASRLLPLFKQKRFFIPEQLMRKNYEDEYEDLVKIFVHEEYRPWPYCLHDDILDCLARIQDDELGAEFPDFALEGEDEADAGYGTAQTDYDELRA